MATKIVERTESEAGRSKAQPPPLYKVRLLNDDYTPMEFVVQMIEMYFGKNREQAMQLMLQVHHEGSAICGVYPRDVAETKVRQVTEKAREHQHPLQCIVEEG